MKFYHLFMYWSKGFFRRNFLPSINSFEQNFQNNFYKRISKIDLNLLVSPFLRSITVKKFLQLNFEMSHSPANHHILLHPFCTKLCCISMCLSAFIVHECLFSHVLPKMAPLTQNASKGGCGLELALKGYSIWLEAEYGTVAMFDSMKFF